LRALFEDSVLNIQFPKLRHLGEALQSAKPRPRTPLWPDVERTLGHYLAKANSGAMDAKEALDSANYEIREILQRSPEKR
jgi:multiple sugar transport system substrate-binding protein